MPDNVEGHALMYKPKTLQDRVYAFADEMILKFYRRAEKHPGESSVTDPNYDWSKTNLEDIERHALYEFLERFPQYLDRFPEVDKAQITIDDPKIEDIDGANLHFLSRETLLERERNE